MHPEVDECVRGWYDSKLTRAEILLKLHSLSTLEQQLELLSRLPPDFTDEARDSLSELLSIKESLPGAHIPSQPPAKEQDPEQIARQKAHFEAYRQRQQRLLEYLSRLKSSHP